MTELYSESARVATRFLLRRAAGARPRNRLFGYASSDGNFYEEFGEVQHRFHRGPGWFVGREKLAVLLVVGCKVLTFGQMRQHGENIVERSSRGCQNHLDTFDGVASLLANVFADRPGNRVPAGLTGDEHNITKTCGWGEIRIPRR